VSLDNLRLLGLPWTFKLIPGKDKEINNAFIIEVKNIVELKTTPKFVSLSCGAGAVYTV
jgi:hypothetical protein